MMEDFDNYEVEEVSFFENIFLYSSVGLKKWFTIYLNSEKVPEAKHKQRFRDLSLKDLAQ